MKRILVFLLALIALPALAQYAPPGPIYQNSIIAFQPLGKTSALSASTITANVALSVSTVQVQIVNPTTGIAFVIFCATSSCTANVGTAGGFTSDYPVAAGAVVVITVPAGTTYAAAVLSASTGTLYFTPGAGT